jgi:hypothetical protein
MPHGTPLPPGGTSLLRSAMIFVSIHRRIVFVEIWAASPATRIGYVATTLILETFLLVFIAHEKAQRRVLTGTPHRRWGKFDGSTTTGG